MATGYLLFWNVVPCTPFIGICVAITLGLKKVLERRKKKMLYESMSDMFLDNRRGLEKSLKNAKPDVKEAALNAYDWAVSKALENQEILSIYKDILGKNEAKALDDTTCNPKYMNRLVNASYKYYTDVKSGKKVGYSSLEE